MAELKLGNKYECFNCGVKFYDLGKGTATCPKCGADQSDAEQKENPLVSQAVRRRRRAELQPDDGGDEAAEIELPEEEGAVLDDDLELDTEGLEDSDEEEAEDDDEV